MKKHLLIAAAALVLGVAQWSSAADEAKGEKVDRAVDNASNKVDRATDRVGDATRNASDKTKDKIGDLDVKTENSAGQSKDLPAGIQKATKDDSDDIRDSLSELTEAAMSKSLHSVRNKLVDADRNRLKDLKDDDATLAGRVEQIRKDWNAKYGKDFDIDHKVAFGQDFKGFVIVQGEIANPQLLSNWPVQNQKAGAQLKIGDDKAKAEIKVGGTGAAASADGRQDTTNKDGNKPSDRNLEKGRNVAIVTIPMAHGTPEVTASMIHELPDQWRFDIPDNIDSQKFYQNLLAHLTEFGEMKDKWPADVNEASRMAAHHVLEALYDMPTGGAAQAQVGK
jgi:flagellar hook-basal body complex protein FliE